MRDEGKTDLVQGGFVVERWVENRPIGNTNWRSFVVRERTVAPRTGNEADRLGIPEGPA